MSVTDRENPYIEAKAKKKDVRREDCYWNCQQEDVLYDGYLMLRDAGYSKYELKPLGELIERTTIYEINDMENLFEMMVNGDI